MGLPFWNNIMFAIGIIVANVPEGLLPTVTLSLAMATQRMARRNALVRHLPAVETLGSTTAICSDKTGTLTLNRMTVKRLYADDRFTTSPDWHAAARERRGTGYLLRAAALCHNVQPTRRDGKFEYLGDPLEVALVEFASRLGLPVIEGLLGEIPFDSDRMRMSVVVADGSVRMLYCKGALEAVLEVADGVEQGGRVQPLDSAARWRLLDAEAAMAGDGLRVLAFAWRALAEGEHATEQKLVVAGLIGLEDPPRPEVPAAIARCRDAGIRVIMVTGDHPRTALAVAREIGLVRSATPVVLRGEEVAHLSAAQLQLALDAPEVLFTRVSAEQKMLVVQALQRKGEVVAVTGDGVNDAPALKTADIGIAMGIAGTDVAKEASDMILLDDNFATIVNAVEEGRAVFENLRKFLTYILTSNIPELVPYLAYVLFRIPLPLTIIQILAVDLGTDMLPALALGAERPDPGVMRRPPRRRSERLLNLPLILRAYLFLGLMEAAIALAAFFFVLDRAGWSLGEALARTDPLYLQATTACLAGIVAAQVVNVFLCRHPRQPSWRFPLAGNPLLLWGIAFELGLILLIVYTPLGNRLFGTAPLAMEVWLFALPCALGMVMLEEGRKALARARERRVQ
jgi:calcium-translocating P-type ATPase